MYRVSDTKFISLATDMYFQAINNNRELYNEVQTLIDRHSQYERAMPAMARMCTQLIDCGLVPANPARPNRIQLYFMLAQSVDRLGELPPKLLANGVKLGYLTLEEETLEPGTYDAVYRGVTFNEDGKLKITMDVTNTACTATLDVGTTNKQPEEDKPMEFKTVHYINDIDIESLDDDALIRMIRSEQKAHDALSGLLGVGSTAINNKLNKHDENIAELVRILDSRINS